jgi:hypothetical protein
MKLTMLYRLIAVSIVFLSLFLFMGSNCGGGEGSPGAYSYNTAISTMGGTYTSNVIPVHYYVGITTNIPGTVPLAPGFGDVYSLVEYSTNGGVSYHLCHNTEGNPGDYFTFLEAPSLKEATFNWDVDRDLGAGVSVNNCSLRVRVFHAGDDPCSDPPKDVETTEEFNIALGGASICGEPPSITTESIPDATDEESYSNTFAATGGYGDLTWSLGTPIDPTMVTGLELTPGGVLSGTPVVQGDYKGTNLQVTIDVWVTDSCPEGPRTDNAVYTLIIYPQIPECAPPPEFLTDQSLPSGMEEEVYSYTLQLSSMGEGALTFTTVLGALPSELTLNTASGLISGTPDTDTAGNYPLTFRVTDSCPSPQSDEISFILMIEEPTPVCDPGPDITTTSLTQGTVGENYNFTMAATGGHGNLTWNTASTLPDGVTFSTAGVFSGIPTEFGTFPLTIVVEDECFIEPQTDSVNLDLVINEAPPVCADPPVIDDANLPDGTEGSTYPDTQLTATDGEGALTWTLLTGNLPPSLDLSTDGLISGDIDCGASEGSPFNFTVQVTDSCEDPGAQSDTHDFTIEVDPPVCNPLDIEDGQTPPQAEVLAEYNYAIILSSTGEGTLTWALDRIGGDDLPEGMDFADGLISGTPALGTEGDYNIIINVSDECPCSPQSDQFQFTLVVDASSNVCFQEPVEVHTFCLQCPDQIDWHGTEVISLWFIHDGFQNSPARIIVNISYNSEIAEIDQATVMAGPVIPNPSLFSATVVSGVLTLTYDYTMIPQPVIGTGLFALIPIRNINESGTLLMPLEITIQTFQDDTGADLNSSTMDCEILMIAPS